MDTALEEATTFMEYMPPVGWADVATKRDLEHSAVLTATALRAEMASLEGALRAELASLGGNLHGEMASMEGNLRAELHRELRLQTYAILGGGSVLVGLGSVLSHLLS